MVQLVSALYLEKCPTGSLPVSVEVAPQAHPVLNASHVGWLLPGCQVYCHAYFCHKALLGLSGCQASAAACEGLRGAVAPTLVVSVFCLPCTFSWRCRLCSHEDPLFQSNGKVDAPLFLSNAVALSLALWKHGAGRALQS